MTMLALLLLCISLHVQKTIQSSMIPKTVSIRGHPQPQSLPMAHCNSWPVWTCELKSDNGQIIEQVDSNDEEGWVNPNSFETLFCPSDLPMPLARPAIGVVMANGSPRYLMPSVVLSLQTPSRMWRNRGLNSIPRAKAWIDMFAAFASPIDRLKLSSFGQIPDSDPRNVRFLEDINNESTWAPLDKPTYVPRNLLRPEESSSYEIETTYDLFKKNVLLKDGFDAIKTGYHFVDIPLVNVTPIRLITMSIYIYICVYIYIYVCIYIKHIYVNMHLCK
jgi:hypothetical protein